MTNQVLCNYASVYSLEIKLQSHCNLVNVSSSLFCFALLFLKVYLVFQVLYLSSSHDPFSLALL